MSIFVVPTLTAEGPAPLGARASAGIVLIKFVSSMYTG